MDSSLKICIVILVQVLVSSCGSALQSGSAGVFPGVSRDLASFCAARPSLPIDLASMLVHVKRNVSFNYKLYLFSNEYVFQTGQIVPRDDFRIHSFPVKLKRLSEFWPSFVATYQLRGESLNPISSYKFNLNHFLRPVLVDPSENKRGHKEKKHSKRDHLKDHQTRDAHQVPEDARSESLPGDPAPLTRGYHEQHQNLNRHIRFDRDDQVSSLSRRSSYSLESDLEDKQTNVKHIGDTLVPVGTFSSFYVNLTYMVRKDFGQSSPELIRIQVDSSQFLVNQLVLIGNGTAPSPFSGDYSFLNHKILRDTNTRITSINQIYEDWITRNFYTVVYIQRRQIVNSDSLEQDLGASSDLDMAVKEEAQEVLISDRLVFRGSSAALLGADQLDYEVKASAFITEKNGLHYYLEFVNPGKFYLGAVDWTKRPFKMIDAQHSPIKATRTLLDNEELLLCPPAICYADRPVDEVVAYGRIAFPDQLVQQVASLFNSPASENQNRTKLGAAASIQLNESVLMYPKVSGATDEVISKIRTREAALVEASSSLRLSEIVDRTMAGSNASQIQTRLHLRDWIWPLARTQVEADKMPKFSWRYELARRNDVKAKPDSYGFALTGHEIEASYRVFNELFLIAANQLITINYTLANETVTSSHPLDEEFTGLSSSLLDPITAAYHDRYSNQIFFFKGDRYVGYDYATKKPLDDFLLDDQSSSSVPLQRPLITTLPVIGLLGRQDYVDAVYHDLTSDLVFVFTGMKFYSFPASEFKDGLQSPSSDQTETMRALQCINEHFLSGCNFDRVFRNPCLPSKEEVSGKLVKQVSAETTEQPASITSATNLSALQELDFNQRQQMKLRSIAAGSGLLDLIVERTLLGASGVATPTPPSLVASGESKPQDRTILYLLFAIVALIVILALALVMLMYNWTKSKQVNPTPVASLGALGSSRTGNYMSNQHYSRSQIVRDRSGIKATSNPVGVVISKGRSRKVMPMNSVDNSVL